MQQRNMRRICMTALSIFFPLMVIVSVYFFIPSQTVFAAASDAGLVPCGTSASGYDRCTLCHLVVGVWNLIQWGMKVMTFFALVVIVAMAIWYIVSAGDDGMMKQAKTGIKYALVGFALMLLSWLIVNVVLTTLAKSDLGIGKTSWNTFSCDAISKPVSSGTSSGTVSSGGGTGGGVVSCEDITAAKTRLSSGGTVCNGAGSCKTCDTSAYDSIINQASAQYGIDAKFIKAIIARESTCNTNSVKTESDGTSSCGLMQVNTGSSSYTCGQLQSPQTGIMEGTRILKNAYTTATSLKSQYGNTVTVYEIAAAIHNAGAGQSQKSNDCQPPEWPTIPMWGCPINPGSAQFNACDIRDYACDVGACVN